MAKKKEIKKTVKKAAKKQAAKKAPSKAGKKPAKKTTATTSKKKVKPIAGKKKPSKTKKSKRKRISVKISKIAGPAIQLSTKTPVKRPKAETKFEEYTKLYDNSYLTHAYEQEGKEIDAFVKFYGGKNKSGE